MFGLLSGVFSSGRLIMFVVVGLAVAAAFWYWNYSQDKIAFLQGENAKLQLTIDIQHKTIETITEQMKRDRKNLEDLTKKYADIEKKASDLTKLLTDNNITELAKQNPALLEEKINQVTKELLDDLEKITDPNSF